MNVDIMEYRDIDTESIYLILQETDLKKILIVVSGKTQK